MVAVFASGVIGRFIYIQIPRTIEGRELSLNEVRGLKADIGDVLKKEYNLNKDTYKSILESTKRNIDLSNSNFLSRFFKKYFENKRNIKQLKKVLQDNNLKPIERKNIISFIKHENKLNRKIDRLTTMQNLFKYWHVVHLPFALIMLIIMIIHVIVTITFGYKWIF